MVVYWQLLYLLDELLSLMVCSSFLHLFWLAWIEVCSDYRTAIPSCLWSPFVYEIVFHPLSLHLWCLYQQGMFLRDNKRMSYLLVQSDGICLLMVNWSYLPICRDRLTDTCDGFLVGYIVFFFFSPTSIRVFLIFLYWVWWILS